jgi:hypothetical protein
VRHQHIAYFFDNAAVPRRYNYGSLVCFLEIAKISCIISALDFESSVDVASSNIGRSAISVRGQSPIVAIGLPERSMPVGKRQNPETHHDSLPIPLDRQRFACRRARLVGLSLLCTGGFQTSKDVLHHASTSSG